MYDIFFLLAMAVWQSVCSVEHELLRIRDMLAFRVEFVIIGHMVVTTTQSFNQYLFFGLHIATSTCLLFELYW